MPDPILEKFARTVVRYSLETLPGDVFLIRATTLAIPLVREVYREALVAGAHPTCQLSFDGQTETFYRHARDEELDWVSPVELLEAQTITTRLTISAPFNTRGAADVDP